MVTIRPFTILFTFLAGTFIGSYVITIISRAKGKEKIRGGYSHCLHCNSRLEVKHILPIISYFYYKGKCPFCRARIGGSTPLWEIGMGLLAIAPIFLLEPESDIYVLAGTWGVASILQLVMRVQ